MRDLILNFGTTTWRLHSKRNESPRDSSIGWKPHLMKRRLLVRILPPPLVWTCQKKKKKARETAIFLIFLGRIFLSINNLATTCTNQSVFKVLKKIQYLLKPLLLVEATCIFSLNMLIIIRTRKQ
jgi:hypothetical protein